MNPAYGVRSAFTHKGAEMRGIGGIHPGWGVTVVRLALGSLLIVHGYQKWFEYGLSGVEAMFAKYGLPLPGLLALIAALVELVGGILLLLGLFTRWVALLVAIQFVVATFYVQLPLKGYTGAQFDLLILATAILLVLAGPGRAAADDIWQQKR